MLWRLHKKNIQFLLRTTNNRKYFFPYILSRRQAHADILQSKIKSDKNNFHDFQGILRSIELAENWEQFGNERFSFGTKWLHRNALLGKLDLEFWVVKLNPFWKTGKENILNASWKAEPQSSIIQIQSITELT